MQTFFKLKLIFSWLLFVFLLFLYNKGAEGMFLAAGLIIWICGPLFFIGIATWFVHSKVFEAKGSNSILFINLVGLIGVIIFAVNFSIGNGT